MLAGVPATLPLFPLENVVLLPEGVAPLHIFEPRYRQMMEHALAHDRRIGMIAVRPEHAHELAGEPPLYAVGCAGVVAEHQRLPDGRFHLLLRATHRFRVVRELPREAGRLYRVAEVSPLEERVGDQDCALRARERVIGLVVRLARRVLGPERSVDVEQLRALELAQLASGVAQSVGLPTREKQAVLEADTLAERLDRLASALDFHLALLERAAAGGPESVH
jgi:Lon protease-like protein